MESLKNIGVSLSVGPISKVGLPGFPAVDGFPAIPQRETSSTHTENKKATLEAVQTGMTL